MLTKAAKPLLEFASLLEVSAATVSWKDAIAMLTWYMSLLQCFMLTNVIAFMFQWIPDFVFKFNLSTATRHYTNMEKVTLVSSW
jgi:hypothetical protein